LEKTLAQLRALQHARPAAAEPDDATESDRPSPAPLTIDYEAAVRWLAAHPLADER
jgi:hypothetical protein